MNTRSFLRARRGREAGVVLFIALIVLVAMSFAGIAIMRSIGAGVLVASNLAFKQTTTAGAERGVEAAKAWLLTQSGTQLENDNLGAGGAGYYSSWGSFDPLAYNWKGADVVKLPADAAGTEIRYVMHRLCFKENASVNAAAQQCVMKSVTAGCSGCSQVGFHYGSTNLKTKLSPYYRVTVRSDGPKNTVSYVQVIFD